MYHFLQYEMARSIQETRRRQAERIAGAARARRTERAEEELEPETLPPLHEVAPVCADGAIAPVEVDRSKLRRTA